MLINIKLLNRQVEVPEVFSPQASQTFFVSNDLQHVIVCDAQALSKLVRSA
jgi:hypothetical protein